jgi:mannose-6-phosphate isomerase-like protein (cupin superfamily)
MAGGAGVLSESVQDRARRFCIDYERQANSLTRGHLVKMIHGKGFTGTRPWEALDIARLNGITVRLHWTDQPYKWHVNDGEEVFVVLDGCVEMRYREAGIETSILLQVGDIFHATLGTEHVAHPLGAARILVVESEGSV